MPANLNDDEPAVTPPSTLNDEPLKDGNAGVICVDGAA